MKFKEGDEIAKNFGSNVYNYMGEDDISMDYEDDYKNQPGLFDGTVEDEQNEA